MKRASLRRHSHCLFVASAVVLGSAGCAIPYAAADVETLNTCSTDSDCGEGSYCARVDDTSACVASSVDLQGLVFEVRPPLGMGETLLSPALIAPGSFSAGDGSQVINLDLKIPAYVDVSPGTVYLPCSADAPIPARVTFQPVPALSGLLEGEKYEAAPTLDQAGNEAFEVNVPPGVYDLYLQPQPDLATAPGCATAPPIFLPRQTISKDSGFAVHASAPLLLSGTLKLSQKEDFTKWFLEVVEPFGGRTISEVIQPAQEGIALEVPFELSFDWTAKDKFTPIVRLRPPEGSGKPIIHWKLDAIALGGIGGGEVPVMLDVSAVETLPRHVGGQVLHDGDFAPATVTLRSTSISGSKLTRYETVVETDESGHFESDLPPGEYMVIARPHKASLAVGLTSWTVAKAADCFCGNSVKVPSATTLAGTVRSPLGDPAFVEVRLTPANGGALSYLANMLSPEVQPRPKSGFSEGGDFTIPVDAGLYNLTLVPPDTSGYPWLVRSQQLVSEAGAQSSPVMSLEPLTLQSPVVVRGRIFDASGNAVAGAAIRAWIPAAQAISGVAPSAVQIGQAVADTDGTYFLLLPPSIK